MKSGLLVMQILLMGFLSLNIGMVHAEKSKKITHVVMVWLKEPGNEQQRRAFIEASEKLSHLPGIVNRHVGVVLPSDRVIVDDTFDVAVTVTMKNKAALKAYLNNPMHKKILKDTIKPLINRVVAYDFISQ